LKRVRAQIVEYKLADDQHIHLVLFDRGAYMIAEMPAASCLPRSRDRPAPVRIRRFFEAARCGTANELLAQPGRSLIDASIGFPVAADCA
jgi:hypothetical protein